MQETRSKHRASWPAMIAAAALAVAAAMPVATHAESDAVIDITPQRRQRERVVQAGGAQRIRERIQLHRMR